MTSRLLNKVPRELINIQITAKWNAILGKLPSHGNLFNSIVVVFVGRQSLVIVSIAVSRAPIASLEKETTVAVVVGGFHINLSLRAEHGKL